MSYECHITMIGDKESIEDAVNRICWSFSAIDNDVVLGKGIKCYATTHYLKSRTVDDVINRMNSAAEALQKLGCNVIRRKVELIVYDTKGTKP